MPRELELQNEQLWEEKYSYALYPQPSSRQRRLERMEKEIQDIKIALTGNSSSRLWQEWKMKLSNLQIERKFHLWAMYGPGRYPRVEGQDTTTPPKNLKEQIPDL